MYGGSSCINGCACPPPGTPLPGVIYAYSEQGNPPWLAPGITPIPSFGTYLYQLQGSAPPSLGGEPLCELTPSPGPLPGYAVFLPGSETLVWLKICTRCAGRFRHDQFAADGAVVTPTGRAAVCGRVCRGCCVALKEEAQLQEAAQWEAPTEEEKKEPTRGLRWRRGQSEQGKEARRWYLDKRMV